MNPPPPSLLSRFPGSAYLKERAEATLRFEGVDERLAELYLALTGLEEPDFAAKLDQDPSAMIWEMIVAKILRESDFNLLPRKPKGPDFQAAVNRQRIVVEAICPGLGDPAKPDSVPELRSGPGMRLVPTDKILLRIAGALALKKDILDRYRACGTIRTDAACVIAISSQKIGQAWGSCPCAGLTATLGHGLPFAVFNPATHERVREGFTLQERVAKTNGRSISTLPFLDVAYASVSGLLYSDTSPTGFPYDLLGDAHFIHNPRALHPIPRGTLRVGHEYVTTVQENGSWQTEDIGFV